MTFSVGLCLPQLGPHVDGPTVATFCQRVEALGFDSVWAQEHLFYPHERPSGYHGVPGAPVPEVYRSVLAPLELLAVAGAMTSRARLGTSVLIGGYHRPVELAQRLATLDVLSGGRLIVGLGVGWSDDEHAQMDVDFRSRGERMDELVDALLACWGPDPVAYEGRFFSIPPSDVRPKPVQRPHPPLLSGMHSERGLLRTVERFDLWNPVSEEPATALARLAELNARRPSHLRPLGAHLRLFVEPPPGRSTPTLGLDGLGRWTERARDQGLDGVIIDCNFWSELTGPTVWCDVPDLVAAALSRAGVTLGAG